MPITQDATAVANRWAQNLGASVTKITSGVNAVTTSPTSQAAAASQLWLSRLNDPATMAKWQRNLNKVTLSDWQTAMKQKGIPRISQGAQAAIPKMVKFMTAWLPYEAAGQSQIKSMPDVTLEDRIARAAAMIRYNAAFPGY